MRNRNLARLCTVALLTLAAIGAVSWPAQAAWKIEDVKWRFYGRGNIGFGENGTLRYTDTTFVSAAPARVDTTTAWTMLDCDNMPLTTQGANAADSLAAGYLIIVADSTVASSVNFKNTTVTIQVNYGFNSAAWQNFAAAYSPLATDGTKALIVPLFERLAAITTDVGIDYLHPHDIFAPQMRALVTWGTAAAAPMSRIRIKKFITSQTVTRQGIDY